MLRALVASLLIASALPALAQEGVNAYPAAFFQENQPATALDMVRLVPGFRVQAGDSGIRGFSGTVGNVLIDGQLPTSKEESIEQVLQRISASAVERIELIRGAADMHGHAVLANVVRIRSVSLKGRAEAEGAINTTGSTAPRLALNITRQGVESVLDVSASYGRRIGNNQGFGTRGRFLPDGTPVRLSEFEFPSLENFAEFSTAYRQPLWGGDLNLGGGRSGAGRHRETLSGGLRHRRAVDGGAPDVRLHAVCPGRGRRTAAVGSLGRTHRELIHGACAGL